MKIGTTCRCHVAFLRHTSTEFSMLAVVLHKIYIVSQFHLASVQRDIHPTNICVHNTGVDVLEPMTLFEPRKVQYLRNTYDGIEQRPLS